MITTKDNPTRIPYWLLRKAKDLGKISEEEFGKAINGEVIIISGLWVKASDRIIEVEGHPELYADEFFETFFGEVIKIFGTIPPDEPKK